MGVEGLRDQMSGVLMWDAIPARRTLFHYTDLASAEAIFATTTFRVGSRHPSKPGLYACEYQPGSRTADELRREILDGSYHLVERTEAVVVIVDEPALGWERDAIAAPAWRISAPMDAELYLPVNIRGWGVRVGDRRWLLSDGCFFNAPDE